MNRKKLFVHVVHAVLLYWDQTHREEYPDEKEEAEEPVVSSVKEVRLVLDEQ